MNGSLEERLDDLRLWATVRIEWCRTEELKRGSSRFEAATERRALQTVLRILWDIDPDVSPARSSAVDGGRS